MGRITSVLPANSVIWAFRNGSDTARLQIRRIAATTGFDGTGQPDSASYALYRYSGADFGNGTAIPAVKANSLLPASVVTAARQNSFAALSQAGVLIESSSLIVTQNQRDKAAIISQVHRWQEGDEGIVLNPGEGLCIKLEVPSVVGDFISGTCNYDEIRHPF
jgi:hypothetical protein